MPQEQDGSLITALGQSTKALIKDGMNRNLDKYLEKSNMSFQRWRNALKTYRGSQGSISTKIYIQIVYNVFILPRSVQQILSLKTFEELDCHMQEREKKHPGYLIDLKMG